MNWRSREIKEKQKVLLHRKTVDKPRFTHEDPYRAGKTRNNGMILNNFRHGNWHHPDGDSKGQDIVNLGPWIPDPRGRGRTPNVNNYVKGWASRRREQYIGPYSATDSQNDYQSIGSSNIQKLKSKAGREMLFRRGEVLPETIFNPTNKDIPIRNRKIESPYDDRDEILDNIARVPSTTIRNITLNNVSYLAPGIQNNIEKLNYADLTQTGRNTATYNHLNNMILWNKAITTYHKDKTPLSRSPYLSKEQIRWVEELKRTGRSEAQIVSKVSKINQTILKGIREYKRDSKLTLHDIVMRSLKSNVPDKRIQQIHDVMFDQRVEEQRIQHVKRTGLKVRITREIMSSGEEILYDDKGTPKAIRGFKGGPGQSAMEQFDDYDPGVSKKYTKRIEFQTKKSNFGHRSFEMDKRNDRTSKIMGVNSRSTVSGPTNRHAFV